VREDTFCINIAKAKRHLTSKTKAVMPVHLYGQSADMQAMMAFAARHRLLVLQDAAEGGIRYDRRHVGTFGNMGLLSYYGSKTITGGEGGGEFPAPIATNILSSNGRSTRNALDMWNFYRLSKKQT
jgi:perosamine synthetase